MPKIIVNKEQDSLSGNDKTLKRLINSNRQTVSVESPKGERISKEILVLVIEN